ncbi:citrulline utilization hydrolase CtlX [Sphingomicrobium aestuariivivum]|uniref:citrulline utilization hydrolase CtlX n=1 Tax=Sphingomicrobium aestuariivivum TaxID=1582356 RepID=UPI001FD64F5B|nr:arginine deiminase-related protein [Sphingomicrobium aestuariivivum]MCJ8191982.1 arginine deiminase-related protein [Sphingomicrobium aestuariivivum]
MNLLPSRVVMVRPHHFAINPETAPDNAYQSAGGAADAASAMAEVEALAGALRSRGVEVMLFEDEATDRPDAVFPNNWFSAHADGTLILYPMRAENRRGERREDIVEALRQKHVVSRVVDLSHYEAEGRFCEGTGSIVFDHAARIAFACRSPRTDGAIVEEVAALLGYRAHLFDAAAADGTPVYHTNVMMALVPGLALVGAELVRDPDQREALLAALGSREVVALDEAQIGDFCGNAFTLAGEEGPFLALSARAASALTEEQRARIRRHVPLVPVAVPTIEQAGGSVRCMLAAVHLPLARGV